MDLALFRERLHYYLNLAEKNQKSLAVALNMHPNVLSRKLNYTNKAVFSRSEVKQLFLVLSEWGSLNYRGEVNELLDLLDLKSEGFFTAKEWQTPPLDMLDDGPGPAGIKPVAVTKQALPVVEASNTVTATFDSHTLPLPSPTPNPDLPRVWSSFVGREREIDEVAALLAPKTAPYLVTLTGVGGTGKTRLALEVAARLLPYFPDGVFFLALENITERAILVSELVKTLEIRDVAGKTSIEVLKQHLNSKKMLLVMDNFEQLVDRGATLLSELLKAAPNLKILVTSRFPLQLLAEQEYRVFPLQLPSHQEILTTTDLAPLEEYPALALFIARAQAVKPDFGLNEENKGAVVEICRRLDGLPLALELAAARLRAFSPQILLERLNLKLLGGGARDLPSRQQTIRATIDWSYNLLNPAEQTLFARLSIFAGGFTLEAAEAVCTGEQNLEIETLEGIESLLFKNLLRYSEDKSGFTRYVMLQTIGEYGQERLKERGEWSQLTRRYTLYYLKFAQNLEPRLKNSEQGSAIKVLDSEYDNLRNILSTGLKESNTTTLQPVIELAIALAQYWDLRNFVTERRTFLEQALALTTDLDPEHTRLLNRLGYLNWRQGNYPASHSYYEAALTLSRQSGDKFEIALALQGLALIINEQVNFAASENYYEESIVLWRELGDKYGLSRCLMNLGQSYVELGYYDKALPCHQESLEVGRQLGDKRCISQALIGLAQVALEGYRDFKTARTYFEEALALSQQIGDVYGICVAQRGIGTAALYSGDSESARQILENNLALSRQTGDKRLAGYNLNVLGRIAFAQQDFENSRRYFSDSLQFWGEMGVKSMVLEILPGLSLLASLQPDSLEAQVYAARLGGAISAMLASTGAMLTFSSKDFYDKALETARLKLGTEAFNTAFDQGTAMSMDEAVSYALTPVIK